MSSAHPRCSARVVATLVTALSFGACSPSGQPTPPDAQVGANPKSSEPAASTIKVCMPQGQHAYLSRLRCPDGQPPKFQRLGSVAKSAEPAQPASAKDDTDDHLVDAYQVTCGEQTHVVYMDMYHCNVPPPEEAPPGFSIVPPSHPS